MEPSYSTNDSTDPFLSMSSSLPPAVVGPEAKDNDTLKNHPWTTERAKVAAETEISPPISPKQHAHQAGFVEPLQDKTATQIIREISDLVDGRDKTVKVIQYFAKVFLWLFLSNPKQSELLASRIKALAKQFSTTRKVLRLGHFIDPMATVLHMGAVLVHNVQKQGWKSTLARKPDASWRNTVRERLGDMNNAIGFVQDISDDIYCLGVIGVLDRSFADKAEPWSNRLWMVGVSIDLHENLQSIWDVKQQIKALQGEDEKVVAQRAKLENKLHWLQVTTVKLSGDFLFCAYDNLHCSFSDGFQAVTGFISGLAGAYKFVGKLVEA
ncbi:Peroxisomal membrane protein PMP27 [Podila minutissima]|uniref:Peroxisomal membrane protein PMP27 n=1 Tax=Podila minutissima TaxID=64525 RepID=A0A9P5SIN0_9FUNG|nr:Peroxisomal membrane protein PMP27 [Podila minutissima]